MLQKTWDVCGYKVKRIIKIYYKKYVFSFRIFWVKQYCYDKNKSPNFYYSKKKIRPFFEMYTDFMDMTAKPKDLRPNYMTQFWFLYFFLVSEEIISFLCREICLSYYSREIEFHMHDDGFPRQIWKTGIHYIWGLWRTRFIICWKIL